MRQFADKSGFRFSAYSTDVVNNKKGDILNELTTGTFLGSLDTLDFSRHRFSHAHNTISPNPGGLYFTHLVRAKLDGAGLPQLAPICSSK
jgi:hypothetical protein